MGRSTNLDTSMAGEVYCGACKRYISLFIEEQIGSAWRCA